MMDSWSYTSHSVSTFSFEAKFGESVGLDMKLKVETECDVYDKKAMMDSWSNYHYNPLVASWFSFTETALTSSGQPTARFHKYTLTHNPAQSSTKRAEIMMEVSAATRQENQQIKKIKLSSQQAENSEHQRKLESCLNKLNSKQGYAFSAQVNCKLTGSQTQDFSYSITAGAGNNNLEHKWNMDLHLQNQNQKVCMDGYMKYPTSYSSRDSQKCQYYTEKEETLRQQMSSTNRQQYEEEYRQLEKEHTEAARQKQKYCSKKVEQSKSLDYTEFDVTYSSQLPRQVYTWAKRTNMGLKAALYQYISYIGEETNQNKITVKLNINQELNSLTMTVASPEDTTRYRNIRLPYQLAGMIPFVAGKNPAEQGYKALTGESWMSQCVVGEGYVQTFDQKTYSYQIDECDHVVASDCSGDSDHSVMVLAKEVNGMKHITILSGQTKIQLSPAQAYSNSVEQYQLSVNGQEMSLQQNKQVTLSTQEQITAYYGQDQTVTISTPSSSITHYGKTVEIEEKGSADGSHCGLCGDYNNDKRADLKSPKKCIFQSSKLFGKSYRTKSSQCSPLSQQTVEEIKREEQECANYETKRTQVSSIFSSGQRDSYSIKKHSYIYKKDQLCISQEPVVQCSEDSIPKSMTKKTIKFVCLPEGRISKLYSDRIERGESPQELKHQPVAFTAQMDQPVICGPSQL